MCSSDLRFPWKKFSTGRGCIHACSFCWNPTVADLYHSSRGSFTRRKSPRRAVDEVLAVKEKYPLRNVHFSDDLFTVRSAWLEEFAPLYRKEVGIPFSCNSSIELATERNMRALAEAGCRCVCIGVETGNERLRSKILNKTVTNEDVRRAADTIHRFGMEVATFNMLAAPGESLQDAFDTIALNQQIHNAIVESAHNDTLSMLHRVVRVRIRRILYIGNQKPDNWGAAMSDHEEMVAALTARDGERLAGAMHAHAANTWQRVSGMLEGDGAV